MVTATRGTEEVTRNVTQFKRLCSIEPPECGGSDSTTAEAQGDHNDPSAAQPDVPCQNDHALGLATASRQRQNLQEHQCHPKTQPQDQVLPAQTHARSRYRGDQGVSSTTSDTIPTHPDATQTLQSAEVDFCGVATCNSHR
ncbi:hypothetical protein NDU88_005420 [Pleurodeles waltl]|uniref:Uncharacterized protein n=1 Tax=Pleurodeles waltl TaxID=8319 RepID=A0AAV7VLQ8_PLEWA|nr:hypothetical protein NDU88_005420 [Pleurodeles waltl]